MTVETETEDLQQLATLQADVHDVLRLCNAGQGGACALRPDASAEQLRALSASMASLLARRIGGRYVTKEAARAVRDAAVLQAFNGRNRVEVMQQFGISRALFYNILSRHSALGRALK